jgi:hypothetical protein
MIPPPTIPFDAGEAFDPIAFFGAVGLVSGLVLGMLAVLAWGIPS